jgi:hypothetical protein
VRDVVGVMMRWWYDIGIGGGGIGGMGVAVVRNVIIACNFFCPPSPFPLFLSLSLLFSLLSLPPSPFISLSISALYNMGVLI